MTGPLLSVVIAAYNAATTLSHQLDALARQDLAVPWEILVCDNGSTDGTQEVARDAQTRLPHLRLVDGSARRGPGAARNVGARVAAAPFLAFCDADDVVDRGWARAMLAALGNAEAAAGRSRRPEYNSRPGTPRYFTWGLYRVPFFPYLAAANAGNLGIRRDVFLELGGFDERLRTGEDLDLCWRLQLAGYRLVEAPGAVVTFRNRPNLRTTAAQTYAYGVGNRALAHKYVHVTHAFQESQAPSSKSAATPMLDEGGKAASAGSGILGRTWHKLVSVRRPSDLTNVTRTAAAWLGYRLGSPVAHQIEPLEPPTSLPTPSAP